MKRRVWHEIDDLDDRKGGYHRYIFPYLNLINDKDTKVFHKFVYVNKAAE